MRRWIVAAVAAVWRRITRACRTLVSDAPVTPLVERSGPFLEAPIVDVEFADIQGNPVGSASAMLIVKLASSGVLVASAEPAVLVANRDIVVHGYSVWFGDDRLDAVFPRDVRMHAKDSFSLDLRLPVVLNRDIGTNLWGDGGGPPKPQPPEPESGKLWIPRPIKASS